MALRPSICRFQPLVFERRTQLRNFSLSKRVFAVPGQPVSPHVSIYKTFGRPFAKVFLGAVFTYQLVYWAWLRLEADEMQREKELEIQELEEKARGLAAMRGKVVQA